MAAHGRCLHTHGIHMQTYTWYTYHMLIERMVCMGLLYTVWSRTEWYERTKRDGGGELINVDHSVGRNGRSFYSSIETSSYQEISSNL